MIHMRKAGDMFSVSYLAHCRKPNNTPLKEYMFFGIDFIYKVQSKVSARCRGYLEPLKECLPSHGRRTMNIGF